MGMCIKNVNKYNILVNFLDKTLLILQVLYLTWHLTLVPPWKFSEKGIERYDQLSLGFFCPGHFYYYNYVLHTTKVAENF